jgi:CHAT domain-containing protein
MKYCLFLLFLIFNTICFAESDLSQYGIKTLEDALKEVQKGVEIIPKDDKEKRLKPLYLMTLLNYIKPKVNQSDFQKTAVLVEPYIFEKIQDSEVVLNQLFTYKMFATREVWILKSSQEETFQKIKNACENDLEVYVKLMCASVINDRFAQQNERMGDLEKALEYLDKSFNAQKDYRDYYEKNWDPKPSTLEIDLLSNFNLYNHTGKKMIWSLRAQDAESAAKYSDQLALMLNKYMDYIIFVNQYSKQNYKALPTLSENLQSIVNNAIASSYLDSYLGRYDNLIKNYNLILSKLPSDSGNDQAIIKARIYKDLDQAYKRKGDSEKAGDYADLSYKLMKQVGLVSSDYSLHLMKGYIERWQDGDYEKAIAAINEFQVACLFKSRDDRNKKFCSTYASLWKSFADDKKTSSLPKDEIDKINYFKIATYIESEYLGQNDDAYITIASHYAKAGEKKYAAFYYKKYINSLQKQREMLSKASYNFVDSFTEKHSDELKDFASIFFDVGDYAASYETMRIIKENNFFDYVRRGTTDNFFTYVPYDKEENDFQIKINALIDVRNKLISRYYEMEAKNNVVESNKLDKLIISKGKEINEIQSKYKNTIRGKGLAKTNSPNLTTSTTLASNEAEIQISVEPASVSTRIYTKNNPPREFRSAYDRNIMRSDVLEIQKAINKNLPVPQAKLEKLSELIFKPSIEVISNSNINTIKIRSDDYLILLPPAIFKFNKVDLGELFIIETLGIGKASSKKIDSKVSIDAFGASEGNGEFSPLAGVKKEIQSIKNISSLSKSSTNNFYLDKDFNKKSLISSLKTPPSYLHIASHFKSKGNNATLTKLLLGDGSTISLEDLRSEAPLLNSQLVTLSACETANLVPAVSEMNFKSINNIEGLSNVFLNKGARYVISTLWDISDNATPLFMQIFYSLLLNNDISPSYALSLTQNIFRSGDYSKLPKSISFGTEMNIKDLISEVAKYNKPYYWAAFQVSTL